MPKSTPTVPKDWAEVVLPKAYINPSLLKTYLDSEFERLYTVQQVGDQYHIRTAISLTQKQLDEIRHLKAVLQGKAKDGTPTNKARDDVLDNTGSVLVESQEGGSMKLVTKQSSQGVRKLKAWCRQLAGLE